MLTPTDTALLHEALRPPRGYELEQLVATTYSLDLVSLLSIPLAFTSFAIEDGEGRLLSDPLLLLEGLRRHGERVTVLCQAGAIAVPLAQRSLYVYLEDCVVPVSASRKGGVFHPKLWIASYAATGADPVYRVLCLTRNLTDDRSRDTILVLEGAPGTNDSEHARPLVDFVHWLAGRAREAGSARHRALGGLADALATVVFTPPEGFRTARFCPLGIPGYREDPIAGRRQRMLIVSPFLSASRLSRIAAGSNGNVLVSRPEEIAAIPADVRAAFSDVYVVDDAGEPEEADDELELSEPPLGGRLRGLHTKLYVADDGWNARLWTGSANATSAAFDQNVEFLVELIGRKSACGVERVLGPDDQPGFRGLLVPFEPLDEAAPPDDPLERRLDEIASAVAQTPVHAHVDERDDAFDIALRVEQCVRVDIDDAVLRCWPITLAREAFASPLELSADPAARFSRVPLTALTAFFGVEVRIGSGKAARETRFVARWPLVGAPTGRANAVLLSLLDDRERVLAFFRLMLAEPSSDPAAAPSLPTLAGSPGHGPLDWVTSSEPLLEALVRTLESDPSRLDGIARIVAELGQTDEGRRRIPDSFLEIWNPIWEARESMRDRR